MTFIARRCAFPSCITVLNMYNDGRFCMAHDEAMKAAFKHPDVPVVINAEDGDAEGLNTAGTPIVSKPLTAAERLRAVLRRLKAGAPAA